jgi:hypothetical protein
MHTIDLGHLLPDGILLIGRALGAQTRTAANLDRLDREGERVLVTVPHHLTLSSSFWIGMFAASVRALGEAAFREQYQFTGPNVELIVDDGIRETLWYSATR